MRSEVILNTVSEYFNIPVEVFTNPCNRDEVVKAKFIAIHFLRTKTNIPNTVISFIFNYQDPSAVVYACKNVSNRLGMEWDYKYDVDAIERLLKERDIESDQFYYDNFQENDFYTNEEINSTNIVVCS